MKANIIRVNTNRTQISSPQGYPLPALITRAWNISSVSEDVVLEDQNGNKIPFIVVPLTEGEMKVGLADNPGEPFLISSAEITASVGIPLMYLITRVYKEGTTVTNFNIGI